MTAEVVTMPTRARNPRTVIAEQMRAAGMDFYALARATNMKPKQWRRIVAEGGSLMPWHAIALSCVFPHPPIYWIQMDAAYDLAYWERTYGAQIRRDCSRKTENRV
jgi:plasmid maintenance system antidote protein VapI